MDIPNLSPQETAELLRQHPDSILLDVREDDEVAICQLSGSLHMPMNLVALRHNELPDEVPIIVYCHHGVRSMNVARYLAHLGFDNVHNLSGGIDAWSQQIDPSVARY